MTPDLTEKRLREQLHAAVEGQSGSYVEVDPLTALDTGRRVLRRRRITAVAGTAAAALVVGVGAWSVLSDRADDERTLPAVTSTVTGESVTLQLGTDADLGPAEPISAVVTVDETSGKVEFRLQTETGSVLESTTVGTVAGQATWTGLAPHVMAAVVPAEAAAFVPVWAGAVSEQEAATEVLPDGRVAAAWRTDVPTTGTQFAGIVWTDGSTAFTAAGQPLLSRVVDDDIVIFANPESGAFGYVRPRDGLAQGDGEVGQAREQASGAPIVGVWAPDDSGDGGAYIAYLPPITEEAANRITVEATSEVRVRDVTTYFPDGSGRMTVAHIDGPADSVVGLTFPGVENNTRFG